MEMQQPTPRVNNNTDLEAQFKFAIVLIQDQGNQENVSHGIEILNRLVQQHYPPAIQLIHDRQQQKRQSLRNKRKTLRAFAMQEISKVPSLYTVNGAGFKLSGCFKHDPATGSYETIHYFVVLFVPMIPTSRYRVIQCGNSYQFLGKVELQPTDFLPIIGWVIFFIFLAIST